MKCFLSAVQVGPAMHYFLRLPFISKVTLLELVAQFINLLLVIDNIAIQYSKFCHCLRC